MASFRRTWRMTASLPQLQAANNFSRPTSQCSPNNLVFSDVSLMAIFAEVTENERITDRHLRGIHPLPDYDASESQSMASMLSIWSK